MKRFAAMFRPVCMIRLPLGATPAHASEGEVDPLFVLQESGKTLMVRGICP